MSSPAAVLGIDAGGSSTRARALEGKRIVHIGSGGPGNPLSSSPADLRRSYELALEGCPSPAIVAACVAGTGSLDGRRSIERILGERFPEASLHVVPDYVAAWMAAPEQTDIVVVCGTGSIACACAEDGTFKTNGGHGWMLGDHGSAARLGQALLQHFCLEPVGQLKEPVQGLFGTTLPSELAERVRSERNPASAMAKAAPLLTAAAERGEVWATEILSHEMDMLARTAAALFTGPSLVRQRARMALAGGVFQSPIAQESFSKALTSLGAHARVVRVEKDGIHGAVRLAQELALGDASQH